MEDQENFTAECNLAEKYIEVLARYLSCNGEVMGIGPTIVFAMAATLFLYSELGATFFSITGDNVNSNTMEMSLVVTMLLGMLSLMVHLWVCSTRLFQYYMEAVICESPMFLLEYTTGNLLGDKLELVPLGPLTKFLRHQQPQIHITLCWFIALCYADYVRKNYCRRFNMPYLEQWQSRLHDRASRGVSQAVKSVNSFVGNLHSQLRSFTQQGTSQQQPDQQPPNSGQPNQQQSNQHSARQHQNPPSQHSTSQNPPNQHPPSQDPPKKPPPIQQSQFKPPSSNPPRAGPDSLSQEPTQSLPPVPSPPNANPEDQLTVPPVPEPPAPNLRVPPGQQLLRHPVPQSSPPPDEDTQLDVPARKRKNPVNVNL